MNAKQLRARWQSPEGLSMAADVFRALSTGSMLGGLGLERVDGRLDLRGLDLATSVSIAVERDLGQDWQLERVIGRLTILGDVEGADFRAANLEAVTAEDAQFKDCSFLDAKLRRFRVRGATFESVDFSGADLQDAALGFRSRTRRPRYDHCSFVGAKLRSAHVTDAEFVACDFSQAVTKKLDFGGSSLERCVFSGPVEEVIFYGSPPAVALEDGHDGLPNEMLGVDLSRAQLRFVEFRNLDLSSAILPDDEGHIIIRDYEGTMLRLRDALANINSAPARRLTFRLSHGPLRWMTKDQRVARILQLADFDSDEVTTLLQTLEVVTK